MKTENTHSTTQKKATMSTGEMVIPGVLRLALPKSQDTLPLMFDSPHSGTFYPEDFNATLDKQILAQNHDTWVNELYSVSSSYGATWLEALFSRNYIDPNRNITDIDPKLLDNSSIHTPLPEPKTSSQLGRGLLWRMLPTGEPIYSRQISNEEIKTRIKNYYHPYHDLLRQHIMKLHKQFGQVWHVNCHSMPSVSGKMSPDGIAGIQRPDFILGNHNGASCDQEFTQLIHQTLREMGYQVTENIPYKGEELTSAYSKPILGFNSIQIEVNRALYMNEVTREKHEGFDILRDNLEQLICRIVNYTSARIT